MYKIYTSEIVLESDTSDKDRSSSSRSDHNKKAEEFEDEDNVILAVIGTTNGIGGQESSERYLNPRKVSLLTSNTFTVNSRATEIQMLKYQMTEFHIFFI